MISKNKNLALRIIIKYFVASVLWIMVGDWILERIIYKYKQLDNQLLSGVKGIFFVILTSWIFYELIKRNLKSIQESEERYRKLVEFSPQTVLVHIEGVIVYINDSGVKLFGAKSTDEIIGKHILEFIPLEDREYTMQQMRKVKEEGKTDLGEQKLKQSNGNFLFIETISFQTIFSGENAIQVIGRDITERKKAEERIQYLAFHDTVTGLPNRHSLYEHIKKVMKHSNNRRESFAVMLLDLDRFKMINDTLGHNVGDQLLKKVALRLKECLHKNSFISRYGGDEFVIILDNVEQKEVFKIAEKIIERLKISFLLNGNEIFITPSIGISMYPKDGEKLEVLIKNADAAMYSAKDQGRNNFCFFDKKLNEKIEREMQLVYGLKKALENDEFVLFYQPQFNLYTGEIVGMEALLRWEKHELGFVSPEEFIPIAEETGLIIPIGEWVLKTACNQVKCWQKKGLPYIHVAVNVSVRQFQNKDFLEIVSRVLRETGLEAKYLELEITESIVQNIDESIIIINNLKALGIKVAIDDFGTGYSSLSVLKHLPIDQLKIDKSFIADIDSNGDAIVRSIIQLGGNLNYKLVAEGIENEEQIIFLKKEGCQIGQGYYFNKPLNQNEAEKILKLSAKKE